MCYPTSGYVIFSLRKLKLYRGRVPGAGGWGPDMRAGGRTTETPQSIYL